MSTHESPALTPSVVDPEQMPRGRKRRQESDIDHHEETEQEEEDNQLVPELLDEIIMDIISRLPIKSVFICRRVCKLWLSLISGSDFAKLHLSRSQVSLIIKRKRRTKNIKNLQLIDLEIAPFVAPRDARMKLTTRNNLPRDRKFAFNILNSCNGLLCLLDPVTEDPIYVCNPILGEYVTLPRCDPWMKCSSYGSAFGFDPTTNDYKVVRSLHRRVLDHVSSSVIYEAPELEIYTIGKGSRRNKGKSLFNIRNRSFSSFLKGAIHWLSFSTEQPDFIHCFDFGTEHFREVPQPSELTHMDKELSGNMRIGVLRDCLSISYFTANNQVKIWLMKDYGVKESWSTHLVIQNMISTTRCYGDFYEPVMILESGKILFLFSEETLHLYDPRTEEYRNIYIHTDDKDFRGIAHIPSLVSLRDVARGENLKMCCA